MLIEEKNHDDVCTTDRTPTSYTFEVTTDEYMIRKITDGRMAPASSDVRAALPDTPHSCLSHWQLQQSR